MRYILSVKIHSERIFRVGRGAPVDADTLQAGVFWYCRVFDVQLCPDERCVVMY